MVLGTAVALVAIVAVALFVAAQRPGDVSDPEAPFEAPPEPEQAEKTVNWPTYGLNRQRTRHLPVQGLRPPFTRRWRFYSGALLEFSPILVAGTIYGVNNDGLAFALDADTGKVRWRKRIARLNASSPTYADGRIYTVAMSPPQVMALNARTGRTAWKRDLPGPSESSPIVHGGRVYFGDSSGSLWALNARSGGTAWRTRLAGEVKAAPAFDRGILYVGDYGGEMWAIRARDGSVKWRAGGQGAGFGRSGRFYSTPTVAFGRVYAGNVDRRMYSFVAETGGLAWTRSTGGFVYAAPAAADTPRTRPTIYFGSYDGRFYALDARDGSERWSRRGGGAISGAASVIGEIVYVANIRNTETWGFATTNGRRVYRSRSGAFNPVISDGRRIYQTGYSVIEALEPRPRHRLRRTRVRQCRRSGMRLERARVAKRRAGQAVRKARGSGNRGRVRRAGARYRRATRRATAARKRAARICARAPQRQRARA